MLADRHKVVVEDFAGVDVHVRRADAVVRAERRRPIVDPSGTEPIGTNNRFELSNVGQAPATPRQACAVAIAVVHGCLPGTGSAVIGFLPDKAAGILGDGAVAVIGKRFGLGGGMANDSKDKQQGEQGKAGE